MRAHNTSFVRRIFDMKHQTADAPSSSQLNAAVGRRPYTVGETTVFYSDYFFLGAQNGQGQTLTTKPSNVSSKSWKTRHWWTYDTNEINAYAVCKFDVTTTECQVIGNPHGKTEWNRWAPPFCCQITEAAPFRGGTHIRVCIKFDITETAKAVSITSVRAFMTDHHSTLGIT